MGQGCVRVLYVQDPPGVGTRCQAELERVGVEITSVGSGEPGLESVRGRRFHLILVDVLLASGSGYDVCRQMKEDPQFKMVPFIMLSRVPAAQGRREAMRAGALAYINKGDKTSELADRLLRAVSLARSILDRTGSKYPIPALRKG